MFCTQGLSVANAIFATIAIATLQQLSPTLQHLSQDVGSDTNADRAACLTSLGSWTSAAGQCQANEGDQCPSSSASSATAGPSSLSDTQVAAICDALSNVQCEAPRPAPANTTTSRIACGLEVNIFTDLRPDDLWSIAALFSQATSLNCRPEDYPIKHVFGGGGMDVGNSHWMLRRLLRNLRRARILPGDDAFNIDQQTHPGPLDWGADRPRYRTFYGAMSGRVPETFSPRNFASEVFRTVKEPLVMRDQQAPIMLLLRPVYEFAVYHTVYLMNNRIINSDTSVLRPRFFNSLDRHGVSAEDAGTMMEIWRRSEVYSSQKLPAQSALGAFAGRIFQNASNQRLDAMSRSYFTLPRKTTILDSWLLLANVADDAVGGGYTVFSQYITPDIYQALDQHPRLSQMFRMHARNWNVGNLQYWSANIRRIVESRAFSPRFLAQFDMLEQMSSGIQPQISHGTFGLEQEAQWGVQVRRTLSLLSQVPMTVEELHAVRAIIGDWLTVAHDADTRVNARDLLLPLALTTWDNPVKTSLRRVRYRGVARGGSPWEEAPAGSASNIWLTWSLTDREEVHQRHQHLVDAFDRLYGSMWPA